MNFLTSGDRIIPAAYYIVLHKFFVCANGLLEFYELHFYSSLFLLQSS
jgi:hypothetical protein